MAKVMISLPDELLKRIDAAAKQSNKSRSLFLQEAAEVELSAYDPEWVRGQLEVIRRWSDEDDPFDSTDWIRHDRDTRNDRH